MRRVIITIIFASILINCSNSEDNSTDTDTESSCLMSTSGIHEVTVEANQEICGTCTDDCQLKLFFPKSGNYTISLTQGNVSGTCGSDPISTKYNLVLTDMPGNTTLYQGTHLMGLNTLLRTESSDTTETVHSIETDNTILLITPLAQNSFICVINGQRYNYAEWTNITETTYKISIF